MADFQVGDIVVLSAGSMRMAVESIEGDAVNTVWCHEGVIGRDSFPAILLRKWEQREDTRSGGGDRGGFRGGKPPHGDRDDKPRGKPGWDGKPREKKFFRKD
ncbi:hypothetical protein [Oceanibium sediminis]|uniref:hypothetical protein n=1 Tax=Oceanibium sediminis TaxID=2026339 RepID=UPI000DD36A68|nr:hypothetical protein [Oceanibium sediminis]